MKDFLSTLLICFIICAVGMFFFGGILFRSIWAVVFLVALVMAISITSFISQEERIGEIEKKLEEIIAINKKGDVYEREE